MRFLPHRKPGWWWSAYFWIVLRALRRGPDVVIGGHEDPYLKRWFVIPRNRLFNVYLHQFHRSDDDRALHDHPWPSVSFILGGRYLEHTIAPGGIHRRREYTSGDVVFRGARHAHRIELFDGIVWTLFITGPRVRSWGFHCADRWVPWEEFTDPATGGATVGRGCGE